LSKAQKNAKEAGFDGVELHGANGYLVDEFLRDGTNKREDNYGGSVENRCRFALEIIDKCIGVFGSGGCVGIKISPCGRFNDMFDSNPTELYKHLLGELGKRRVAFVEVMQPPDFRKVQNFYGIDGEEQIPEIFKTLKPFFVYPKKTEKIENNEITEKNGKEEKNWKEEGKEVKEEKKEGKKEEKEENKEDYEPVFIANNGLTFDSAKDLLAKGYCDMVTFGRSYISNPDLVYRFKNGFDLTPPDFDTFYTPGEKGYTTYSKYDDSLNK